MAMCTNKVATALQPAFESAWFFLLHPSKHTPSQPLPPRHVMLLGQDKRELGALVFPDEEYLATTGAGADADAGGSGSKGLQQLLFKEVCTLNAARQDYHPEDHIGHIQVG